MSFDALLRGVRPRQWAKNTLVFAPAIAAHLVFDVALAGRLLMGLAVFSGVAGASYLFNDVRDVDDDRWHVTKRNRPFAAGQMSARAALVAAAVIATLSLALAVILSPRFAGVLAVYGLGATAYSVGLKRWAAVDVIVLTALYVTRVVAGAVLVDVHLTRWFLAFAIFAFGSLALAKRVAETQDVAARHLDVIAGRGYNGDDLPVLTAMGGASVIASALVYSLYIMGEEASALYDTPGFLWFGLALFVYWMLRMWLFAGRGTLREDPIAFAALDRASYVVVAAFLLTIWIAA